MANRRAESNRGTRHAIAFVCAAALWGCRSPSRDPPLIGPQDIKVRLGLPGAADRPGWNSLFIEIQNSGGDWSGRLTVEGLPAEGKEPPRESVIYEVAMDVGGAGSAPVVLHFPVLAERWRGVLLRLEGPSFSRVFRIDVTPPRKAENAPPIRVLIAGRAPPHLESVREALAARVERRVHTENGIVPSPSELVDLCAIDTAEMPSLAAALEPFQLVFLDGDVLGDASPGAIEALRRWVEGGGSLVALPGKEWSSGLSEDALALLGVDLLEPQGKSLPVEISLSLNIAPGDKPKVPVYFRPLRPRVGSRVTLDGLAVHARHGAGLVTTFSAAFVRGPFPTAADVPAIHEALLPAFARAASFPGFSSECIRRVEGLAATELESMYGRVTPSAGLVVKGFAAYLTLGFLLPALVFLRSRRRERMYLMSLATAVCGAVLVAMFGLHLVAHRELFEIEELSLLRSGPDGRAARATSFLGVVAHAYSSLRLNGAPQDGVVSDYVQLFEQPLWRGSRERKLTFSSFERAPATVRVRRNGAHISPPLSLRPCEIQFVRADYRPAAPTPITVSAVDRSDARRLRVVNESGTVAWVWVVAGGVWRFLGSVQPSTKVELPADSVSLLRAPAGSRAGSAFSRGLMQSVSAEFKNADAPDLFVIFAQVPVFPAEHISARRNALTAWILESPWTE